MSTPHSPKLIVTPKKAIFGSRVRRITTSTGIKKMRRIVRLFGRFMAHPGGPWFYLHLPAQSRGVTHYRRTLADSQRFLEGELDSPCRADGDCRSSREIG